MYFDAISHSCESNILAIGNTAQPRNLPSLTGVFWHHVQADYTMMRNMEAFDFSVQRAVKA